MLTAQQIAELDAAANGNVILVAGQNTILNTYPGCNQGGGIGATDPSRPIDASKFNSDQCGLMSIYIDTTNTALTTAKTFVMGGQVSTGRSQVATDIYGITLAAGGLLADSDVDDQIGVDSANFAPTNFIDWMNDIFSGHHIIAKRLNIERTSGSADLNTLGKIRKYSLKPEGDWEVCNPKLQQNFCDPCIMDDGSRVSYEGYLPITTLDAIALDIPIGLALTLEFCVFLYENSRNMTQCAA